VAAVDDDLHVDAARLGRDERVDDRRGGKCEGGKPDRDPGRVERLQDQRFGAAFRPEGRLDARACVGGRGGQRRTGEDGREKVSRPVA
jgi:hypothetical protein